MDTDYSSGLENPLYSELKYFCRKILEAYNELKEDLTPYRDDRFYRWVCYQNEKPVILLRCVSICHKSLVCYDVKYNLQRFKGLHIYILDNCFIFRFFMSQIKQKTRVVLNK